jgi:peptidoglycan/LPS O-acetylase OafA/YrhL
MTQDRVAIINALRGAAILAVIYHHVFARFTPPGTGAFEIGGLQLLPLAPLANGWLGVSLFFVLSGFVLALPYERGARNLGSWVDVRAFLVRRAARLLPLYYLVSLVCFAFLATQAAWTLTNFIHLMALTFPFTAETFFPSYNWVLWSLGVEIGFSVLFPALLLLRFRIGIAGFLTGSLIFSAGFRVFGNQPRFWTEHPVLNYVKDGIPGRLDDFVLGMVIAAIFVRAGDWRPSVAQRAGLFALALTALYATCYGSDAVQLERLPRAVIPFLNNIFQLGCATGMLALLFSPSGLIRRLWSNRALQLLGMMCYSLYVWHGILIHRIATDAAGAYTLGRLTAYFMFLLLLSTLSYRYIEFGAVRETRKLFTPGKD